MDAAGFRSLLEHLGDADWQAVIDGQSILLVDDLYLSIGSPRAPNAIIAAAGEGCVDAGGLKRESLGEAAAILANYYQTHPLTLAGFNRQSRELIEAHGAGAFAAIAGQVPERTLFVDGGEVVAEPADSPRHPYGVFCELQQPLSNAEIEARIQTWIERDEAYERYLGMDVCRYTC